MSECIICGAQHDDAEFISDGICLDCLWGYHDCWGCGEYIPKDQHMCDECENKPDEVIWLPQLGRLITVAA
jgi:hypothetical protein